VQLITHQQAQGRNPALKQQGAPKSNSEAG
jgi:hypothetical protein